MEEDRSPGRMETVDPRIIEHVGAISAVGAEPEIVDVRAGAVFEDADQLVFRSIKTALAGVGLVPHQKIFPLGIKRPSRGEQFGEVSPVDE